MATAPRIPTREAGFSFRAGDLVALLLIALIARTVRSQRVSTGATSPAHAAETSPPRRPACRALSRPLGTAQIANRLSDQRAVHHLGLYNVMKGATLAVAGLALTRLVVVEPSLPRLLLLVIALSAALLGYYAATVGGPIVNFRPSVLDIALPMALTVAEVVLIQRTAEKPLGDAMPADWVLTLFAWQLIAGCMVGSVAFRLRMTAYNPDIKEMVRRYRRRQRADFALAMTQAALTFCFWLLRRSELPTMRWPEYVFAAVTLLMFWMGIHHQGATSREIARLVHSQDNPQLSGGRHPTPASAPPGPDGL